MLCEKYSETVRYKGVVNPSQSVQVLRKYYMLLFPTLLFYVEGIPGTIIDAYAAGIPVISAKWESYSDVVDEGVTGIGYDFDDEDQFENILMMVAMNPDIILSKKKQCLQEAKKFKTDKVIQRFVELIEG